MKTIQKIAVALIVILGLVNIGLTFRNFDTLSMDALWVAAAGVAVVFAGFLNIALLRDGGKDWVIWLMCLIANIVFLLMFAAAAYILRQSQAYVGLFLFMLMTIYTFFVDWEKRG